MSIGKRISDLRKSFGYSQEYIAEKLNVSRQAVSKWEQDISKPDTGNIIALSSLLNTTVEYLSTGNEPYIKCTEKSHKKFPYRKFAAVTLISVIILLTVCISIYIHTRPVSWDTGACGGGFSTHIFNKYNKELTDKFLNGMGEEKQNVLKIEALNGTHELNWNGREIYLQFDVEYTHKTEGVIKQRLHFTGKRIWIEAYKWNGAIIEG